MRPIRTTISFDRALALALDSVSPIARTERVMLAEANGRVLAEAVTAAADVPAFDRAAMDGFAVRAADTAGASPDDPKTLRCVDTIYTGQAPAHAIAAGDCAEI